MDEVDRAIVNTLQDGFPVSERPFAQAAAGLGLKEEELIARLRKLREGGVLSRFGPLYHAERLGGGLTLAAIQVPPSDFERVAAIVNAFPEVAHNYQRDHAFNMWFVLATERPEDIARVLAEIEQQTGYPVHNMPREREYYVGLKLDA